VIASTICKNASVLHVQKLNDSLAKEQISTHAKRATCALDTKDKKASLVNCQRQFQASKCQSLKKLLQLFINESLLGITRGDWKIKLVSFEVKEENNYTMAELSQCQKYTRYPHQG
jgi:hypothetical protein